MEVKVKDTRRRRVSGERDRASDSGRVQVSVVRVRSRAILSEDRREEEFDSEVFQTDPAYVRVAHGVTKSIGDYESLRVDVAITMPCYKEQLDEVASQVGDRVALMMERELDAYGLSLT